MTTRVFFNDLHLHEDAPAVRAAIDRVLASGWFILGPEVEAFEREFAAVAGARHAIGVANGTDAIALLLRAHDIGPGDEVIVPAMTAAFTALAVASAGARPVLVDIDPARMTLDPRATESAITSRTRAIVPVHLYGQAADMDALSAIATRHALAIVEDCCQAHLATCGGSPVGLGGIGGAFSFYPTKNLGALGDAGAVITNDDRIADRVRRLRNGGQSDRYHHVECGINSRLDELQAAVLRVRLPRLASDTARRRHLSAVYRRHLPEGVALPELDPGHAYHLFPIRVPERDRIQSALTETGIQTLIHYPVALNQQEAFARYQPDACPEASRAAAQLLSLPLHARMPEADAIFVTEHLGALLKGRVSA